MTDLIEREDAIKVIEETAFIRRPILPHYLIAKIKNIPSAENKGEWIPCSERLPEEEGKYLVTFGAFAETINGEKIIFGDIDGSVSEIGYGCYERDIFWNPTAFGWYDLATATPFDKRAIIAWMPLPEPWEGADDE